MGKGITRMSWKTHGKSLLALLGALVMAGVVAYQAIASDGATLSEWVTVTIAVFGAFVVWATANISGFEKAKTIVAAATVILNLLVGFLTDSHLSGDEIMLLVIQALSALGVAGAPASKQIVSRAVVSS